jgi:hypothetical protein
MDAGFIKRVYKTSVAVWLFTLLMCGVYNSVPMAIGVTVGFGISLCSLMLLERLVMRLFVPQMAGKPKKALRRLLVVAMLKYGVIGIVLWVSLSLIGANPIGLIIGIGIPSAVIFLKALGKVITFGSETGRR